MEDLKGELAYYSDKMMISKVVLFFEKKGIFVSKTMIQNYIRQEILPPVINKRYYAKYHILIISIIDIMKKRFSIQEMKLIFNIISPKIFKEDEILKLTTDEINEEASNIYDKFRNNYNDSIKTWADDYINPLTQSNSKETELLLEVLMDSIVFNELTTELINKYTR